MVTLDQKTPKEITGTLAERVRCLRRRRKISQKELSRLSGVSLGSLKRFEQSGEISLMSFVKLALALKLEDEVYSLFSENTYESIEEIIRGAR